MTQFKKELTTVELQALQSVSTFMGIPIDTVKLQIFDFKKTKEDYLIDYRKTNDPTLEALAIKGLEETCKTKKHCRWLFNNSIGDSKLEALAVQNIYQLTLQELQSKT